MKSRPDISKAAGFIWRTARLLDRHRFAYLFLDGPRDAVSGALRSYQNADGGFGHALEPDMRAPVSLPQPVWSALRVLDEIDVFDDLMVKQACDYLMTFTTAEGGVPFALPSIRPYPRVPWLQPDDQPPASINPTAGIVGLLHKHRIDHPWLERATSYCWQFVESEERWVLERNLSDFERASEGYDARAALAFLEFVPDRNRAEKALERLRRYLFEQQIVALDTTATGDIHTPLDFAPRPESSMRRFFSDEIINVHLDKLSTAQEEDGGWPISWPVWTPAAGLEWRGWATIEALKTLQIHGLLS